MRELELHQLVVSTVSVLIGDLFSHLRHHPFVTAHKKGGTIRYDWLSLLVGGDDKSAKALSSNGKPEREDLPFMPKKANRRNSRMAKTNEPTIIKKYANRRLYNTGTSTYVTLEDLAVMVKGEEDFVVYDAKSGDDITRSVLTQIIFEQEGKGQNLLPVTFLRQLIRFTVTACRASCQAFSSIP
jgi:polyhydroxyalkanoate synthesis repressor PhaR